MTNNMVLADMAAMQRIRNRIAEEQAVKKRAALAQGQNMEKSAPCSGEKNRSLMVERGR